MRYIHKQGGGGYHLRQAHENPPTTAAQATTRWENYKHKETLRNELLEEQFFLCCYSEVRADKLGLGDHIEHVEPKSRNPQRTFDYANLAACALDSESDLASFKVQALETFGGHFKLSKYDPNLFISCHQPDCARFFRYLSDGRIEPANQLEQPEHAQAKYTIELLNLNCDYLINLRKKWWDELDSLFAQHQRDTWSIESLAACDLVPTNMQLSQFFSLTRQFFGKYAEQALTQAAPHLL